MKLDDTEERIKLALLALGDGEGSEKARRTANSLIWQHPYMSIFWDDKEKQMELMDDCVIITISTRE